MKIGCFTYQVVFQLDSDDDFGKTDLSTKTIWINSRYSDECQKETLFHELLHVAFEDCAFLDMDFGKDGDKEESIIRYISPRMTQILQDNKWIREFICG